MVAAPMQELERCREIWADVQEALQCGMLDRATVQRLRAHRGQQGIYRDATTTAKSIGCRTGVTVGIPHAGHRYDDELDARGLSYCYPSTDRGRRDANEIAATKACQRLFLPLFVVRFLGPDYGYSVRLAWVVDSDDTEQLFKIEYGDFDMPPRRRGAQ